MIGHRTITGICLLCTLLISAIAAQSASGAGITAVTCEKAVGGFSDSHCKVGVGFGEYRHTEFATNTPTESTVTGFTTGGESTAMLLKATVGGFGLVLEAKRVLASAAIENRSEGSEMWAQGAAEQLVFEEVTASSKCSVSGLPGGSGRIEAFPLTATTKGQGDALKFEPQEGTKLAEFELSGAECPGGLKGKYPVSGTVKCIPTGATCLFSHSEVTAAKSLRVKNASEGPIAGLEGSITISAKDEENPCIPEWPLAATTFP